MNATEMNVKRNLSVLRTHGVPAAGAQVTRSPPPWRLSTPQEPVAELQVEAGSTHLDDLRLCVFRPEGLRRGGGAHCYKAIWFSV